VVRKGYLVAAFLLLVAVGLFAASTWVWWGSSRVEKDTAFVVPSGSSLT